MNYLFTKRRFGFWLSIVALAASVPSIAHAGSTLSFTGGQYTQTFDSLPNPGATSVNTANPVIINGTSYSLQSTIFDFANPIDTSGVGSASSNGGLGLSSTMSGWYGGAATATKFGATFGDQTTGGDLSFGPASSSNRAIGLIGTGTTGATYFGLHIVNNTSAPMTKINVSFTMEQWKQGGTAKTLDVGYTVDATNTLTLISAATSGSYHSLATMTAATGSVGAVDGTSPANQSNKTFTNLALASSVPVGDSLWITGQISDSSSGGQGFGIDNFSFSVPEPGSLGMLAIGGLLVLRRRR